MSTSLVNRHNRGVSLVEISITTSLVAEFYTFIGDIPATGSSASSYRFAATARAATSQARDRGCQFLGIEVIDGQVHRLAGSDAATAARGAAADQCWGRS